MTEANHYDHETLGGAESYVPICKKCRLRMERVGTTLTTTKSIPLYQCSACKGTIYARARKPGDGGRTIGRVVKGHWHKLGPDGEMIPVAHPDDVWG